ncbi:MAG TPA: histidine phosphatase family protein, partial [Polyangiales bacterium]|nr:histidine phosphatase family protein [Polyangiales bacterium]
QRDVDVPLSALGEQQSRALGHWFGSMPEGERPTVLLVSPYVRAMHTAALLVESAGPAQRPVKRIVDERLREKEFGSLNQLTKLGIQTKFPHEAELRTRLGKFYYRPPGGESWCDVILRLRSVWDQLQLQYAGERVLVVAHQAVVLCFRYLLENMTEEQVLAIDREKDVANCGVTCYERERETEDRSVLALRLYNFVAPLEEAGAAVTKEPDAPVGPR